MTIKTLFAISLVILAFPSSAAVDKSGIRLKEVVRVIGVRENALIGYGIVSGLSGTGDTLRSNATTQSISNILKNMGLTIPAKEINSRNVAAVMVTSVLPAFSQPGDKLDVNVTSIGDARSLVGGTLMLTHMVGANNKIYALAQGPLSTGGFKYDLNGNVVQKNHSTAGNIPNGASVEAGVDTQLLSADNQLTLKLYEPDFTTASRVKSQINNRFGKNVAKAVDAGSVKVTIPNAYSQKLISFLMEIESLRIIPDTRARLVINERTGTIASGGDVSISDVTITHGDIKVSIVTDFIVSQPSFVRDVDSSIRTQTVPDTSINVKEDKPIALTFKGNTSVSDLVLSLNKIKTSSRDIISIIQTIKRAGALHAELIIQ